MTVMQEKSAPKYFWFEVRKNMFLEFPESPHCVRFYNTDVTPQIRRFHTFPEISETSIGWEALGGILNLPE
jgi:hypothetical protein